MTKSWSILWQHCSLKKHNFGAQQAQLEFVDRGTLNTDFSLGLCEALVTRYKQRRLNVIVSLLHLLTTKEYPEESFDFGKVTKKEIKNKATELYKRLFPEAPPQEQEEHDDDDDVQMAPVPTQMSLAEGISVSLKPKGEEATHQQIEKDFKILETLNQLEMIRDALMSIPQAFSIAHKSKKRNRLGIERTSALFWLTQYFAK